MKNYKKSILGLGCYGAVLATAAWGATNTIQIFSFDFGSSPSTHIDPTINPGDTVQWVWVSGVHSTTASPGQSESWDSGVQSSGSFTHTFNNLGTFGYYCSLHGFNAGCGNGGAMSGRIFVVQPGASPLNITSITRQGNDIALSWLTSGLCKTNALQRASGAIDGSYTNNYTDIFIVTNTVGPVTNYVDAGAVTNLPASYYRIRLVP